MKFNYSVGPTLEEEKSRYGVWHKFFAWYPVRVGDNECRWLETVHRRYDLIFFSEVSLKIEKYAAEYQALINQHRN